MTVDPEALLRIAQADIAERSKSMRKPTDDWDHVAYFLDAAGDVMKTELEYRNWLEKESEAKRVAQQARSVRAVAVCVVQVAWVLHRDAGDVRPLPNDFSKDPDRTEKVIATLYLSTGAKAVWASVRRRKQLRPTLGPWRAETAGYTGMWSDTIRPALAAAWS